MRIANIIEEGKLGGPQVCMVRVAAALKGQAETVIIMPRENADTFQALCREAGITYVALPLSRITKELRVALRYVLFFPYEIWRIYRILKKGHFDLVHVSGGSWQYKGVIAGKLAGIPVVWHLNDTSIPTLFRRLFAFLGRFADGFIFASNRSRDYYGSVLSYSKPECVIPTPVDSTRFDPSLNFEGDKDLISSWKGQTVVGTVANICPVKGFETFIRAAAELNQRAEHVRFVIVGPIHKNQRTYYQRLQQLADDLELENLDFVGGRSDVRHILKRMGVYVCSSVAESSPISVWEAMAMARPVISTDVGDVPCYVRNGESGYIVDIDDYKAMAERLNHLVNDTELRIRLGKEARKIAIENFTPEIIAQLTLNFYKIVSGNSS